MSITSSYFPQSSSLEFLGLGLFLVVKMKWLTTILLPIFLVVVRTTLQGRKRFRRRYQEVLKPTHDEFNKFLIQCGEAPYPLANFVEESPYMNLLLYPESAKFNRSKPLDPDRFQYLEGCVREDSPFEVPAFEVNSESPLIYVSFGTLGSSDIQLMQRLIDVLGKLPYRVSTQCR